MKNCENLSTSELISELSELRDYFRTCEEIGQGISTKEIVWEREIVAELVKREETELINLI